MNNDPTMRQGGENPGSDLLRTDFQIGQSRTDDDLSLGFLSPPTRAGSIGRLGHYEVEGILGRGGFGVVFKAHDEVLHRTVAIKVLSSEMSITSPARKRFLREARAAAAVRHENAVQVYAIEESPVPYIVMEFIPGESLQARLDQHGPLHSNTVARIGAQIARGLAAAHEKGLIHRDVKPANVLLESNDEQRVKLTDFGLARTADDASLTQSGAVAGTPLYMAPEQARGDTLDHRADLFSLGSVLYTMVSGHPPFRAPTSLAVMHRVCNDTPRPIRDVIPETPDWLCKIIEKLHYKNPDKRFQSALEVAKLLEAGARGELTNTAPAPTRRSVSGWASLIAIPVLLVAIGAAYLRGWLDSKETAAPLPPLPGEPTPAPPPSVTPPVPSPMPPKPAPTPEPAKAATRTPTAKPSLRELLTSPDYEWSPPTNLGRNINTATSEYSPTLTSDECVLIFSRPGKFYQSRRKSLLEAFGPAEELATVIHEGIREVVSMSGDGRILVFASNRDQEESRIAHVWMATRPADDKPFGEPERLPEPVASPGWNVAPSLSSDGLTLLLTSARPGGLGTGHIVMFTRENRNTPFANEVHLAPPVNTDGYTLADWLSPDRLHLIRTRLQQPKPAECLLFSRRSTSEPFDPVPHPIEIVVNGKPVIPSRPWISPDGQRMYFHSREIEGGTGNVDLWMCNRVPKQKH